VTGSLRDLVRTVNARVRNFFDAPLPPDAAPLELLEAALEQLERKAQPSGRGARVFPYTRVVVHVAQPAADRAAIEAVFSRLDVRLRERLAEIRCDVPSALVISTTIADGAADGIPLVRVECSTNGDGASPAAMSLPPGLQVAVLKGQADRAEYTFSGGVIPIGRGIEPSDAFGRVRHNEITFVDEVRDGITETVARAHARVEFDPVLAAYVVFNESSSNPTFVVRNGRSLRINPRDPRGVRLESGDHLHIGRAVLKMSLGPAFSGREST
jgi:FHA domain